jgi:metal-sulfur cluster biosynthetic enzyme
MKQLPFEDRTDSVREKLRLLQAAYAAGDFDLAMSLSEATKDTLAFERQLQGTTSPPAIRADHFVAVNDLPKAWAQWALGWKYCKAFNLFETVGIARSREPVDLAIAFRDDQVTDLGREVRVVRVEANANTLEEVPCQLYAETRRAGERHCQLVVLADVPAHAQATYLVFYGNPFAERHEPATDLRVRGEGYGLDIENHHFTAQLSRQMGQLERLISKRQHGLELYAGGKGHGEPPGIDWAHDYVDAGHFQKLRMRNWPQCPNYDVVRGPLCVRVRRWGFPYSPLHPVFTPSRVHMDQTYVFYAGLPYFFKEGKIDVVKDVAIAAMRDDEWVFSGYSFTHAVWIDHQGKLHEGKVPAENAENLWGVGFYNRESRDAFIALWLEHAAKGFDGLTHGGVPTLHYDGHGQLWSRYPANEANLKAGTAIRQKNAYWFAGYEGQATATAVEQLRHQLLNPLEAHPADLPRVVAASSADRLAKSGETKQTAPLKTAIWDALREVHDEQLYKIDANVVDMGYVYDVREHNGIVSILVTMPHRGRPEYNFLVTSGGGRIEPGIRERLLKVKGVRDVVVDFTWNPPWTVARLTDAGRRALGLTA